MLAAGQSEYTNWVAYSLFEIVAVIRIWYFYTAHVLKMVVFLELWKKLLPRRISPYSYPCCYGNTHTHCSEGSSNMWFTNIYEWQWRWLSHLHIELYIVGINSHLYVVIPKNTCDLHAWCTCRFQKCILWSKRGNIINIRTYFAVLILRSLRKCFVRGMIFWRTLHQYHWVSWLPISN